MTDTLAYYLPYSVILVVLLIVLSSVYRLIKIQHRLEELHHKVKATKASVDNAKLTVDRYWDENRLNLVERQSFVLIRESLGRKTKDADLAEKRTIEVGTVPDTKELKENTAIHIVDAIRLLHKAKEEHIETIRRYNTYKGQVPHSLIVAAFKRYQIDAEQYFDDEKVDKDKIDKLIAEDKNFFKQLLVMVYDLRRNEEMSKEEITVSPVKELNK
ncbi:MAG TPA: hypothetical protein VE732_05570 [Nitrososphaera sp.]|jgi:hypothetical protein|nr:hypothetical protein [Nitrososphaera sp.]